MLPLQKTSASITGGKTALEPSVKNAASKAEAAQSAKTSVSLSAPKSASAIAAAAGLPSDKLSSAIVLFARFFSLPLKPQTLAAIRRQAFMPPPPQPVSENSAAVKEASAVTTAKAREALSLAAAAAESKSVELSPKGLEAYAEAVDPEWQRRHDGGERRRKRQNKSQNERVNQEKAPRKAAHITASALEKMALDSAGKDPLLAVLNKLPGKNGQRWIVLPFDFSEEKRDFRVSMRILLEDKTSRAACMVLDAAESGETERRWLFMLESANNRAMRLTACIQPELAPKEQRALKDELSLLLEIPHERVFVKSYGEPFPFEAGGGDNLRSIDEEA